MATSVQWRDLTLTTGVDALYRITAVTGWEGLPPPRYDKQNRARGHGAHPSPVWADERTVTVEGRCWSEEQRDALLFGLERRFTYDAGEEPLTITLAGRELTAWAQVLRCDPALVPEEWGMGRFGWAVQWRCPDPLRYGPEQPSQSTGLPVPTGGLTYPLTYALDYGTTGTTGQITLSNGGTAPAPILFTVTGPLPAGFAITSGQQTILYPLEVPAGQTIEIDTATGSVLVEGTADRRAALAWADFMQVPAGGVMTVQFTTLGGIPDPAASLVVSGFREAYW